MDFNIKFVRKLSRLTTENVCLIPEMKSSRVILEIGHFHACYRYSHQDFLAWVLTAS